MYLVHLLPSYRRYIFSSLSNYISHPVNIHVAHKHSSLFKPDLILWYDGKTCRFVCKLVFSCLHMNAEANAAAVVCNGKQKEM